jgi:hypothetical protein
MDRGDQAPRPAKHIKQAEMALVGLAGDFWPISNTPIETRGGTVAGIGGSGEKNFLFLAETLAKLRLFGTS